MKPSRPVIIALLLVAAGVGAFWLRQTDAPPANEKAERLAAPRLQFYPADLALLSDFVAQQWQEGEGKAPEILDRASHGVYVAARSQGRRLADSWSLSETVGGGLRQSLAEIRSTLGQGAAAVDSFEIFFAVARHKVDPVKQRRQLRSNIRRGIFGLEIHSGTDVERYSPTYVIASNRKNGRLIELYGEARNLDKTELEKLNYYFLEGPQMLTKLGAATSTELMERGNRFIPLQEVTRAAVANFLELQSQWMWNNLHANGQMTYLFWPSQNREAKSRDNLIRQFMATIALGRIARSKSDDAMWAKSAGNIDFNLEKYYHAEDALGVVELRGKVKLGAVALAALAIMEHKDRDRWAQQEQSLRRTVDHLWQEDGSFRTFYKPTDRNDNHNFYPGEALLMWATLYQESKDPKLLQRFMKSVEYYKAYHLAPENRNPAFIPWHTQAYYMVWLETKSPLLRDFIFEMNDWLLDVQQWEGVEYPDTRGRFHDPGRPFGPPHASATGVYLEGLIDAFRLAQEIGDVERTRLYAQAMQRALRSLMQLQFADDLDMYYIENKRAVRGGIRTTVYDNQIRCDNVQHNLMGTIKYLSTNAIELATSE